jgi:hypothetical protein
MKNLVVALMLLSPLSAFAEDAEQDTKKPSISKWELGLNNSLAFATEGNLTFYDDIFLGGRNSVSLYRNFKSLQTGLVVEGGVTGTGGGWYIAPSLVLNGRVDYNKMYLYGGGSVGYIREKPEMFWTMPGNRTTFGGIVTGVHAGAVYNLSKRFALNVEAGMKVKRISAKMTTEFFYPGHGTVINEQRVSYSDLYVPVSVGVRYRFN